MSPPLETAFDRLADGRLRQMLVAGPPEGRDDEPYLPQVRVEFRADGSSGGAAEAGQSAFGPGLAAASRGGVMKARAGLRSAPRSLKYGPYYPPWKIEDGLFRPEVTARIIETPTFASP